MELENLKFRAKLSPDGEYFDKAYKRLRMHARQLDLFK